MKTNICARNGALPYCEQTLYRLPMFACSFLDAVKDAKFLTSFCRRALQSPISSFQLWNCEEKLSLPTVSRCLQRDRNGDHNSSSTLATNIALNISVFGKHEMGQ
jgi:hypothetical protein